MRHLRLRFAHTKPSHIDRVRSITNVLYTSRPVQMSEKLLLLSHVFSLFSLTRQTGMHTRKEKLNIILSLSSRNIC